MILCKTDPIYKRMLHQMNWKTAFFAGCYGKQLDSVEWLFANEHYCIIKNRIINPIKLKMIKTF